MAHRKSCDTCPSTTDEEYPSGWGRFWAFDPEKMMHGSKDLCPRCSLQIATAVIELRKINGKEASLTTTAEEKPAAPPPIDPNAPGNIGRPAPSLFLGPKKVPR